MSLRRHPVLWALGALLAGVFAVVAVTGVAVWRAAHTDDATRADRVDVIIVLGAAQYQGRPSPVFEGRLRHAVLLYEQGRADTVIVLGGGRPGDRSTEAEAGRDYLVESGVPVGNVEAIPHGDTTLESLRAAASFMRDRRMTSAFLVSDPWHNLRIKRMASDLGFEGLTSATWRSAATSEGTRFSGYLRETFAYLAYRLLGR
ncbi:MAG TPA: YdcF family protein [Actinomycetota bacterium]|nr:YdcF family protein [Actinomycetota bacterium]